MRPFSGPVPSVLIACLPLALVAGCDRQSPAPSQGNAAQANTVAPAAPAGGEAAGTLDLSQRGKPMVADGFTDPSGKPVTLGTFKGQPLLVNLWATWCGPCVKEMPSLDRLAARTRGKLKVLVVNQDAAKQAIDPVPDWWGKANLANLELYRDGENNLGFAFGGGVLPTTILYDAQGKEVWRISGGMDWDGPRANTLLAQVTG